MAGPTAAEAAARVAVRGSLADLAPGSLVLVACSGGADSLALAAATAFVARRGDGVRAGAVVVDHGLQPGSDEVAARAAEACRGLGLDPVRVLRVQVGASGGPEAAARAARYAALDAAARGLGASAVLLGHTLDDQAETVLLGLARGSGARSLAGMAPRRGLLRRPFLALRRADTEAVCRAAGLAWWHDPTNGPGGPGGTGTGAVGVGATATGATGTGATGTGRSGASVDGLPLRSRVRAEVLPVLDRVLGPGVAFALARTASQLRDDADLLDRLAGELLVSARRTPRDPAEPADSADSAEPAESAEPVALDADVLRAAPRALRTRALRAAALEAGAPASAVTSVHVGALDALVTAWRGQGPASLPGPVVATRECGTLVLRPGP